jgi:peptidyl-prolyl cis-trans isomerase D
VDGNYHIILVKERKPAKVLPLDEVKAEIAAQIRQNLMGNQFFSIEKRVADKAFEDASSLKAAADEAGVKVQETGYFSRKDVPSELNYPNVTSAIFDSDLSQGGSNSEPMSVGEQHSLVVRVLDHKPQSTRSLEDMKGEIAATLKHQKAEAIVLAQADKFVQDLTAGKAVEGLNFGEAQTWIFAETKDPVLGDVIFSMKKPADGSVTYKAAKNAEGGVVIVALDNVEDGKLTASEKKQFAAQLEQTDRISLQNSLLNALRAKAKIEINDAFINQEQ